MPHKPDSKRPIMPSLSIGISIGCLGSLFIHILIYGSILNLASLPEIGFELQLPAEVEFGLSESLDVQNPEKPFIAAQSSNVASQKPETASKKASDQVPTKSIELDPKNKPDKKKIRESVQHANSYGPDAGNQGLSAYAPPGTQFALRLDLVRVRNSPLASEVSELLSVIPDWSMVLEGSGINPIRDLDRLFIASPNLRRSKLVIAGQYNGGVGIARQAVENLAALQGKKAQWRKRGSILIAPWFNQDETDRVIALVAPTAFIITRPDDLSRVLAVSQGLAERNQDKKELEQNSTTALLAMEKEESLSLSVEGIKNYVRGDTRGIPIRFKISVKEKSNTTIKTSAEAHYESVEDAKKAREYWISVFEKIASHPLLIFIGMREPIINITTKQHDSTLTGETTLTLQQIRAILGFFRNTLTQSHDRTNKNQPQDRSDLVNSPSNLPATDKSVNLPDP